jgi:hypothetical protein
LAIISDWRFELAIRRKVEERKALGKDPDKLLEFDNAFYYFV